MMNIDYILRYFTSDGFYTILCRVVLHIFWFVERGKEYNFKVHISFAVYIFLVCDKY